MTDEADADDEGAERAAHELAEAVRHLVGGDGDVIIDGARYEFDRVVRVIPRRVADAVAFEVPIREDQVVVWAHRTPLRRRGRPQNLRGTPRHGFERQARRVTDPARRLRAVLIVATIVAVAAVAAVVVYLLFSIGGGADVDWLSVATLLATVVAVLLVVIGVRRGTQGGPD